MLEALHIRNFAIIQTLDLDFNKGMTVITGETGAGKSIIIDALHLALGGRLDSKLHVGKQRCEISAVFSLKNHVKALAFLQEKEITVDEDTCILKRIINLDGKTRCSVNDQVVTTQTLQALAPFLLVIHGQSEQQDLIKSEQQRELLDEYANLIPLVESLNTVFKNWQTCELNLAQLKENAKIQTQQQAFLEFQKQELLEANFTQDEIINLPIQHKQVANETKAADQVQQLVAELTSSPSLIDQCHALAKQIQMLKLEDASFLNAKELLNSAIISLEEASSELLHYEQRISKQPELLEQLDKRLSILHDLARKHRIRLEDLFTHQEHIIQQLNQLTHLDEQIAEIEKQKLALENTYFKLAKELSAARKKAAEYFSNQVTEHIQTLAMPSGKFSVSLTSFDANIPKINGLEKIEFLVSLNKGQALQPLSKVASGGELSRISLAIQVILSEHVKIPTLIFDEIDAGIGGKTAQIVGQLLQTLGKTTQLICITHQPQVAALANQHLVVSKEESNQQTQTNITVLSPQEKIHEIARMLSGATISEQTLKLAEEMILEA